MPTRNEAGHAVPDAGDIIKGGIVVACSFSDTWNDGECQDDGADVILLLNPGDEKPYVTTIRRMDGTFAVRKEYKGIRKASEVYTEWANQ